MDTFENYLVQSGIVTPGQIKEACERQRMHGVHVMARSALDMRILSMHQVLEVLDSVSRDPAGRTFEQVAVELGYLSPKQARELNTSCRFTPQTIGESLVAAGALDTRALKHARSRFRAAKRLEPVA